MAELLRILFYSEQDQLMAEITDVAADGCDKVSVPPGSAYFVAVVTWRDSDG